MSQTPNGYTLETVDVPIGDDYAEVADGAMLEVGGLAVRDDGTVVTSTRQGRIWELDPESGEWHLLTNSLHMGLGLWLDEATDDLFTTQRSALTRISDADGDGWAERFETIADDWGATNNYHEYVFGPVRDSEGNFYVNLNLSAPPADGCDQVKGSTMYHCAPYRGWMIKVTPDGEFIPFASGIRSPCGLGINSDDEVFYTDNQGDYVPACHLTHVQEDEFIGHPLALLDHTDWEGENLDSYANKVYDLMRTDHAAWVPYGQAQSWGGVTFDEKGKFGPFEGQIFLGDQRRTKVQRVSLDEVGGNYQGAVFNFASGLQCGTIRETFTPDGQGLYLGQTDRGWGSTGSESFGLQRINYDGETVPFEMDSLSLQESGFEIEFTKPVDPATAGDPTNYAISHWTYDNNVGYGSDQLDKTTVSSSDISVTVNDSGTRVELKLPEIYITPNYAAGLLGGTRVYELVLDGVESSVGETLDHNQTWYTVNNRPEPQSVSPADRALGSESSVQFDGTPPSNATVLWDGEDHTLETDWEHTDGSTPQWNEQEDYFAAAAGTGDIRTMEDIGDCHLHIEWRAPADVSGSGQHRANSGVFLMENYEIQVLDNYDNDTYAWGWAGSKYGEAAPLVSPMRPPGEWQSYDIIWRGPRWEVSGGTEEDQEVLVRPATVTVLFNGTVVLFNHRVRGATTGSEGSGSYSSHPPELPLKLQDHNDENPPHFRNVWYQPLPDEEQHPVVTDQPTYSTEYTPNNVGQPTRISPGGPGTANPPSDAEYLLEGGSLDGWERAEGGPPGWAEHGDYVEAVPGAGDIQTETDLGDCQLHLEWRVPEDAGTSGGLRGNSGVLLMGRYKLQLLDPDGAEIDLEEWAGAYPNQEPPRVNALRDPGEWQTLDVAWQAPRFEDGELVQRPRTTVLLNGTVVQARLIPEGPNRDDTVGEFEAHGPKEALRLQENGDRIHFRNFWYRSFEVTDGPGRYTSSDDGSIPPISPPDTP